MLKAKESDYPLYRAMRKYGVEHFKHEVVEECDDTLLDEREKYWISYFDSYNNGYNQTLGGQGVPTNDYKEVYELWESGMSVVDIAILTDFPYSTINTIIKGRYSNFKEQSQKFKSVTMSKHMVSQYSLSGNYIKTYITIRDASDKTGIGYAAIYRCCIGLSNCSGMYQWEFGDNKDNIGRCIITHVLGHRVKQYTKNGDFVAEFKSYIDAERNTGVANASISACCNGKRKSAGGFKWERINY